MYKVALKVLNLTKLGQNSIDKKYIYTIKLLNNLKLSKWMKQLYTNKIYLLKCLNKIKIKNKETYLIEWTPLNSLTEAFELVNMKTRNS